MYSAQVDFDASTYVFRNTNALNFIIKKWDRYSHGVSVRSLLIGKGLPTVFDALKFSYQVILVI